MKKTSIVISAALAAMVSGCNKSGEVSREREELVNTETKVNERLREINVETAEEKAEAARDAKEKMAQVEKDAAEKRTDVREDLVDAREDLAEAKRDAVGGSGDVGMVRDGTYVSGVLTSTLGNQLTIQDEAGKKIRLTTDSATETSRNGRQVKLDDFKEGTPVRASFAMKGDDRYARRVEILSSLSEANRPHHVDEVKQGSGDVKRSDGHAGNRKGPDPMDIPTK